MGSPCEVLVDSSDEQPAQAVASAVAACAWHIEQKFSRYRDDNIVARINRSAGEPVEVDEETAHLLDFADSLAHCPTASSTSPAACCDAPGHSTAARVPAPEIRALLPRWAGPA